MKLIMKHFIYVVTVIIFHQMSAQSFQKTKSMQAYKGYFNFYYEESNDKIYLPDGFVTNVLKKSPPEFSEVNVNA